MPATLNGRVGLKIAQCVVVPDPWGRFGSTGRRCGALGNSLGVYLLQRVGSPQGFGCLGAPVTGADDVPRQRRLEPR